MFNFFKKKNTEESAKICFATDIHCHLVPGVDDGSSSASLSADFIEQMQQWGITRIFASPHVTQDLFENSQADLDVALGELQAELTRRGNQIFLDRSAEYRIDDFSKSQIFSGEAKTLPNNYIIVENSFIQEPWGLDQFLFDLKVKGYKPILAHPERYFYYHGKRKRYDEIHSAGTLFQVNLLSLSGYYGKDEKAIAKYLVDKGYVDFLGTDIHKQSHVDSITEYLKTSEYRKISAKLNLLNDIAF